MLLLNIFQHSDGSFAWDNMIIVLLAGIAGYLLQKSAGKKKERKEYKAMLADWESKYKRVEHEYKNYKSNIASAENHNEKQLLQLSGRVKALEGDIRVLSDEKNKFHHELLIREEELKKYSRQTADLEDRLKEVRESKNKSDADWADQLKTAKDEWAKAATWEQRVRSAEEEAQKAKAAIGAAERKKLEAELRLKATAEYAGKVGPLETELKEEKEKYIILEAALSKVNAEFLLQKDNNAILKQELEIKQSTYTLLLAQIEELKARMQQNALL
jgi:chromosome segregation ATPase